MTGRGSPSAVPVPYRPVTEALLGAARRGVVPDITAISHYRAALGALVPEWSSPGCDAHASPVVVAEALLRLLTQAGTRGGLLVLEDLHWTDAETLAVVEYLADNLADSRVLCIFTLRDGAPSAALDLLRVLSARRAAEALEVPRLTPAAANQMAAACLGVADLPAAVARLVDDCDGLPFAVEEVLAAAVASGQLRRDDVRDHAFATRGQPDRADDLRACHILEEVTDRPGVEGATNVGLTRVHREHEDVRLVVIGCLRHDRADRVDAAHDGHAEVNDQDVGEERQISLDCLLAVRGLAHEFQVRLELDDGGKARADHRMIVGDDDADGHADLLGRDGQRVAVQAERPGPRGARRGP